MDNSLRRIAAACLLVAAGFGGNALARPDADHPAVGRALAHLHSAEMASVAGSGHAFKFRDLVLDADGSEHVRFARTYRGLPVLGGDLIVHSTPQGQLRRVSQTLTKAPQLGLAAAVSAGQASQTALADFGGTVKQVQEAQAVIYARRGQFALAWDVKIIGQKAEGMPSHEHLIIDARSGLLLDRWDEVRSAHAVGKGSSHYSGNVKLNTDQQASGGYVLRDTRRGNHEVYDLQGKEGDWDTKGVLMADADNVWGDETAWSPMGQRDSVDAAYGHAVTWDFYRKLGRNGIADDGRAASSRVHAAYYNAFWIDDCFCVTYTVGHDKDLPPLISLEVAGHELTHGVTSHTAGLFYSGEPGGLDEASADIMGTMIEHFARNPNDPPDYLIGEQMFPGAPKRIMFQPSQVGNGAGDCWAPGTGYRNPHLSSGVGNHFFYLLAEGSHPDGGPVSPSCRPEDTEYATGNDVILGVGAKAATRIWYRALTVYMTSDTQYHGARQATLQAAEDLYGNGSVQVQRVNAAWAAVNVKAGGGCSGAC